MNLTDTIMFFGSKANLAAALKIYRSAISNWGDSIPRARQYPIQVLSRGKLKADSKCATCAADVAIKR